MTLTASAPGSIMISGEHAVVYGHPAIVAAITPRVFVRLEANGDGKLRIHSALGEYESDIGERVPDERLRFVLACFTRYPQDSGITLEIDSRIDPTLGHGSSAAVTVATLAVLARHSGAAISLPTLHRQAWQIVRHVQERGSGADLAASLCGGMVAYHNHPQVRIDPLPLPPAMISLSYCGYKTATAKVLALIAERMLKAPERYRQLYRKMGDSAQVAIGAARQRDWPAFYRALNRYASHMRRLGVCDATLADMLSAARAHRDTEASKISGSGLGDAIVTFSQTLPPHHHPVTIAEKGLHFS